MDIFAGARVILWRGGYLPCTWTTLRMPELNVIQKQTSKNMHPFTMIFHSDSIFIYHEGGSSDGGGNGLYCHEDFAYPDKVIGSGSLLRMVKNGKEELKAFCPPHLEWFLVGGSEFLLVSV